MKVERLINLEGLDLEARAAAHVARDAAEQTRQARARREEAHQDRIRLLRSAADKLRRVAGNALWKGIVRSVVTTASAGLELGGRGKPWIDFASRTTGASADAVGGVFDADSTSLQAEKLQLETRAEELNNRAQRASDDLAQAQRLQGSATGLADRIQQQRHAAAMAALRR